MLDLVCVPASAESGSEKKASVARSLKPFRTTHLYMSLKVCFCLFNISVAEHESKSYSVAVNKLFPASLELVID